MGDPSPVVTHLTNERIRDNICIEVRVMRGKLMKRVIVQLEADDVARLDLVMTRRQLTQSDAIREAIRHLADVVAQEAEEVRT